MSYWKLAANAAWAGVYATFAMACLVVLLNGVPPARSSGMELARAMASLAPVYVPVTALVLTTLFVFLRFFAVRRLSPRWQSLKAIVWFATTALFGCAALYALNARSVGELLPPDAREILRTDVTVMSACFLLSCALASMAQVKARGPARRLRILAAAVLMIPVLVLTTSVTGRSARSTPPARPGRAAEVVADAENMMATVGEGRLVLLAMDAASMDHLLPLVAAGELPSFEKMMRKGASSRLDTVHPCMPEVAWDSLLTGRPAWASGWRATERHALPMGPDGLAILPRGLGMAWLRGWGYVTSAAQEGPAWSEGSIWEFSRHAGLSTVLAGWGSAPPSLHDAGRVAGRLQRILGEAEGTVAHDAGALDALRDAVALDMAVRDEALEATKSVGHGPRLLAVRLRGLAEVTRRYLRYHAPAEFGEPASRAGGPLSRVVTGYYEFLDEILGEQLDAAGETGFVMIVSAHGVEPIPMTDRIAAWVGARKAQEGISGSWRRGPDGIFLLHGPGVQAGVRPEEVDLLDVAPTAIYLMGLPIEPGMRGGLLRRVLRPEFLEGHPVHVVPGGSAKPL
ncbi:MAG: alkaline phosphatase family protein [Candidatus Polarisedimenticolia bacterium]